MEEKEPKQLNRAIIIIVIAAGLLSGVVITHYYLRPEPVARYTPEHRVVDSQRMPPDDLEVAEADPAETPDAAEKPEAEDEEHSAEATDGETPAAEDKPDQPTDRRDEAPSTSPDESTASDRRTMHDARERMRSEGVEDYVELTENLFIELSSKMVIMAATLDRHPQSDDPVAIQGLMGDYAAGLLADARVDPDDFQRYARELHREPDRAAQIGERIIKEAEKHTDRRIEVGEGMPGIPAEIPDMPSDGQ